ncbi:hypothetical protein ACS0TY_027512 [Phlomoides rotata]
MEESVPSLKIRSMGKENGPLSSNANPLSVYSTRSKSRMSFHPNSRSDPVPSKPITDTESVEAFLGLSCSDASRVSSIKDLRMKRVFTPEVNSVPEEGTDEEDEKNEERKKLKVSDSGQVVDTGTVNELKVEDERNDIANGLNSKDQEASGNGSHTIGKMALNRCNSRKVFKNASSFSYKRMLPYLMDIANDASFKIEGDDLKPSENGVDASMEEEDIQMTPPEPGMFVKTMHDHGAESLEANKLLSENQTLMGLSVVSAKSSADASKQSPNTKCNTNSMNRSVLNPCSRLRLFNNSRSLSYRRLLPFLMDISKDNSCATTNTQYPILQKLDLVKDNNVNKSKAENSPEKQYTQDVTSSTVPLPPPGNSSLDTNDILVSSMSDSSNLESNVATSETLSEEIPQTQSSPELGLELKDTTSQSEQSSIVNIKDALIKEGASEEGESFGNQKMSLEMGLVLHNINAESIEKVDLNQNSFQVKASSDVFVCPNNRLTKGILKRNPLGCRGLCNCLNCASFRLHADRAFEFSRNQMHGAEEVALELMEELASLRILLEKSVAQNSGSAGIQLNPDLVKQACNKALEAEKMAKERLIELNNDLGAHCRIPALVQPKVTFANNIRESALRAMDPSTSSDEEL